MAFASKFNTALPASLQVVTTVNGFTTVVLVERSGTALAGVAGTGVASAATA